MNDMKAAMAAAGIIAAPAAAPDKPRRRRRPRGAKVKELREQILRLTAERDVLLNIVRYSAKN